MNHRAAAVTHEVCEVKVSGGVPAPACTAAPAAPAGPAMTPPVLRRVAAATASVQRAVLAQRVGTGRG